MDVYEHVPENGGNWQQHPAGKREDGHRRLLLDPGPSRRSRVFPSVQPPLAFSGIEELETALGLQQPALSEPASHDTLERQGPGQASGAHLRVEEGQTRQQQATQQQEQRGHG